jgi:hypothetical protein
MATAQDKFETLVRERLAPWLKDQGFKRKSTTFRRERDDAWQIVNFQRSSSSNAQLVKFTVNLGVAYASLHAEPVWAKRGWPMEYECDFDTRVGLLAKGHDHWWKLRAFLPDRRIADEVLDDLSRHALPWLDLYASPTACFRQLLEDPETMDLGNVRTALLLARHLGDDTAAWAAETEIQRYERGDRPAWRPA